MTRRKKTETTIPAPVESPKRYLWDCLDKRYYDPPPPDVRRPRPATLLWAGCATNAMSSCSRGAPCRSR